MVAGPVRVARKESNCALVVYLKYGPILSGSIVTIAVFIPAVVRSLCAICAKSAKWARAENCAE